MTASASAWASRPPASSRRGCPSETPRRTVSSDGAVTNLLLLPALGRGAHRGQKQGTSCSGGAEVKGQLEDLADALADGGRGLGAREHAGLHGVAGLRADVLRRRGDAGRLLARVA